MYTPNNSLRLMRSQQITKRTSAIAKAAGSTRAKTKTRGRQRPSMPTGPSLPLGVLSSSVGTISQAIQSLFAAACSLAFLEEQDNQGQNTKESISQEACTARIWTLSILTLFAASGLMYRLVSLQGVDHQRWLTIASKQHKTSVTIQGARGSIFDSLGRTLAASVPAISLAVHPKQIKDKEAASNKLVALLGKDKNEIDAALASEKNFVWLARGLAHEKKQAIDEMSLTGVSAFDEFKRVYPQNQMSSTLIGLVGTDGFGLSGLEQQFNKQLQADQYKLALRRDARGRFVSISTNPTVFSTPSFLSNLGDFSFGDFSLIETAEAAEMTRGSVREQGGDLRVSIDSIMQEIVEREFKSAKESTGAKEVYGLVMDANSGQIMAMAQSSGFDPNDARRPSPSKLGNRVIQNSFEPGSTLKPLVAAAALDAGVVGKNEVIDCEKGRWRFGRHTIHDVHPIDKVSLSEVLVQSSNICMAKIGARLGKERLHSALSEFGFGEKTGVELPGETKGILRSHKRWKTVDIATHSFGQGVAVSALQLVQAFASLANGGLLVQPSLLFNADKQATIKRRVLRPETSKLITSYLRGVTEGERGTGKAARLSGLTVYGKTGTAQKARIDGRGYDPDAVLSSFIGYVHGNEIGIDRSLVMLVVVDEPTVKPRWGGRLAGPVFRRSMERIFSHLLTQDSKRTS